jgi:hypothetical protein
VRGTRGSHRIGLAVANKQATSLRDCRMRSSGVQTGLPAALARRRTWRVRLSQYSSTSLRSSRWSSGMLRRAVIGLSVSPSAELLEFAVR